MKKEIAKAGVQLYWAGIFLALEVVFAIIFAVVFNTVKLNANNIQSISIGFGVVTLLLIVLAGVFLNEAGKILKNIDNDNVQNEE